MRLAFPETEQPRQRAFTLMELVLVLALLATAAALVAPAMANFFRGRSLGYEARTLLALTRQGQSRAASEGVPMDLWLDPQNGKYGLEEEASFGSSDPDAVEFPLDKNMQLEVFNGTTANANKRAPIDMGAPLSTASVPPVLLAHPDLPTIRFLPDGSISETSPQKLHLIGRDGASLWLVQSRNRLNYEIRDTEN